jgi:D-psicose/D-tagatose/L-ribulose 3-epimerase
VGSNPTPTDPHRSPAVRLAYNTNGLANHRLDDAIDLIAEAGFDGVALTLDHHHLDPFSHDWERACERLARRLDALGLGVVIETGARFLLDPRLKHEPTLVTPDPERRARRVEFLERAIAIAAITGAEAVSFWSGVTHPGRTPDADWTTLVDGVARVVETARRAGVVAAMEPEPGMVVATVDDYERLARDLAERTVDGRLALALDVGHCLVTQDRDPAEAVRECASRLGTVTVEDMARGVHRHLPFGEGDVDLPAVFAALDEIDWRGLVCVELSRESHRGAEMLSRTSAWLHQHGLRDKPRGPA